jgi:hypothetical protein
MAHQHSFFDRSKENIMGTSLHHKIYLGRRSTVLGSKRLQAMLVIGSCATIGLLWMAIRVLP